MNPKNDPLDGSKKDLSSLSGIRFGFVNRPDKVFDHVETKLGSADNTSIEFILRDNDKQSPSYGLQIHKIYTVDEKLYQLQLEIKLLNTTSRPVSLYPNFDPSKTLGLIFGVSAGVSYWAEYVGGKRGEIDGVDLGEGLSDLNLADWSHAGFRSEYFVLAMFTNSFPKIFGQRTELVIPEGSADYSNALFTSFLPLGKENLKGEESTSYRVQFYLGEKREAPMIETNFSSFFDRYGAILGGIEKLLFSILHLFYQLTHSWGWAIVLLTLFVKILLLPLNIKQTKSMAKMQQLQPEFKRLQEKYADDKQKMNMEVMKLYQTHQVNPLAGCLPMLLQLPIFFSLFYTVGGSVEMYGESFLWLTDLAKPDPYLVMPALFVLSFIISQQKMNIDPNQKMMMYMLPILFFFMMKGLSGGVMIYIVGQSLFSNVEQIIVGKPSTAPVTAPVVQETQSNASQSEGKPEKQSSNNKKKKRRRRAQKKHSKA